MKRRAFVTGLGALLAAPRAASAQETGKVARVGVLASSSPLLEAFRQGLRELGYLEGRNILIEHRSPEGRDERLPELAAELVLLNVDVIVASSQAAVAARKVTATIPIVMPIITDPVRLGLVASVAKPGGNATGFATQNDELPGKWLELVKETHAEDRAAEVFANPEARDHYARALDAAAKLVAPPSNDVIARMRSKLGGVLQVLGDYEAAAASYIAGLELVRGTHDRAGEIDMLLGLSMTYNLYHRGEEAFGYADRALVVSRESNDVARQAASLGHKVMARAAGYGQIVEATPEAEEAVRLSENIGDPGLLAQTLIFAGQLSEWRADIPRAISQLRRGAELAHQGHHGFFYGYAEFFLGHVYLAQGDYEEALRSYQRMSDYASAAGDKFWMARAPNLFGGAHLELYDLDEAIQLCLEGDEVAQKLFPWPEPRGHSLLKVGLAHLERGEHGLADGFLRRAWALLEGDVWFRWRWHIPLLRARGELALAEGKPEEAWNFASSSLEMARQSDSRKHIVRAQRLQGEILSSAGRLEEAAGALHASVALARTIATPRELWLGDAALGRVLARMGQDAAATAAYTEGAETIDAIAARLTTMSLRQRFLDADRVLAVYRELGRRPPASTPSG